MKQLHILFLASWYPSRVLKTNGDFIQRHAEAVALQHNVTVIHVISDSDLSKKIEISDTVINGVRTLIAYVKKTKNPVLKTYRFVKAYQLLIKKVTPFDVIHVNKFYPVGYFAFRLKRKKNIPYIISEHHSIYIKPYNKKIGFIEKFISRIIVKNANYVCPVSDSLGRNMEDFGLKGNYFSVPNVIDTNRFKPKPKENAETLNLLHISSMEKVKNIEGLLSAIKNLESKTINFHINIIGGNAESYKINAVKLGINADNITFINQLPHNMIIDYIQKANIFILFSNIETFSCVVYEAFACGTPVISTDVGGISNYFPKEFGKLIKARDQVGLVDAIMDMRKFTNFEQNEMYNYVEKKFSKQHICESFTNLYLSSLNNS